MILCCGEALIDRLPKGAVPGGGAFNVALALARLGARAGLFCGLSTDADGAMLAQVLAAEGVDLTLAPRSPRPTAQAFVTLTDGAPRFRFDDAGSAGRMLTPDDLPAALPDRVEALVFGGISLASEPCGSAFEALMMREAGRRICVLDPNIRPALIADAPATRARIARMIARADIVKLSDEDLRWLLGAGAPQEAGALRDAARAMLAKGPRLVLLTEGAQGAWGFAPAATVFAPARAVTEIDTVGAGDTFLAGVLAVLQGAGALRPDALAHPPQALLEAALNTGARAAAVTVSRAGCTPPHLQELPP
jgi:fructokinase